jgi:hypothetical protein
MVLLLLGLLACTPDIHRAYEAERALALAVETSHPASWEPDVRLSVPASDLAECAELALRDAMRNAPEVSVDLPLGVKGRLTPRLQVTRALVKPDASCAACFAVDVALDGTAAWSVGPAKGEVPLALALTSVLSLQIEGGRKVTGRLASLGHIEVDVGRAEELRLDARGAVQSWVKQNVSPRLPALVLARLDLGGVPVRDIRLETTGEALHIELLSDVPGATPLGAATAPDPDELRLTIHQSTLTGIARRAAWRAGPQDMDIAVDPRSVAVDGTAFTLGLRLWRLSGRGWWRDYTVAGGLTVTKSRIKLSADTATEGEKSPGAELADPLVALFEGKILEAVVDAVQGTVPAAREENLGSVQLDTRIRTARGVSGTLVVEGPMRATSASR